MDKVFQIDEQERTVKLLPFVNWIDTLRSMMAGLISENGRQKLEAVGYAQASKNEMRKLLLRLLDISDAFSRALNTAVGLQGASDRRYVLAMGNLKSALGMIQDLLEEHGVRKIEFPNGKASIQHCRVLETRTSEDHEDYTILETVERGYYWNDEILRKASVVIAKRKEA